MSTIKISPSLLSADFARLGEEVRQVLRLGADYIHVDVMDGMFVPNISVGIPALTCLKKSFPEAFLDVHLMIARPVRYVRAFCEAGASLLMFHVESDTAENITKAIAETRDYGRKVGLAVKPGTPASALSPWIDQIDMALVMTVEPGFSGQRFMPDQLPKLREVHAMLQKFNPACDLEVDGGISPATARHVVEAGANVLVAGSAIFGSFNRAAAINILRNS